MEYFDLSVFISIAIWNAYQAALNVLIRSMDRRIFTFDGNEEKKQK